MAAPTATSTSSTMTDSLHGARRHHKTKKHSDPFLELPGDNVTPAELPSAPTTPMGGGMHPESLFADLVLAPLTMVSFLLSLFLVDRQQRAWRLSQHSSPGSDSWWTRLTHPHWFDPQPYQDSRNSTWQHDDRGKANQIAPQPGYQGWYARKKHRAVAKMEISDALEMRKRVIFALAAWSLIGVLALYHASRGVYGWLTR